jgi:hypothetical protein|tara:strand:+ start:2026 stop:2415 length:390 start_codon:yes stop_codon:yes gene_type:complete
MALTSKKYSRIYSETGSDGDLITADEKTLMKNEFDNNTYINDKDSLSRLGPVLYQLQQMQDEIDYLRTEILTNKNKVIPNVTGTTNHAISFGALTATLVKGKPVYSVVMTVTDSSGTKVVAKTITLTLS